ncbi:hypothetical protein M0804_001512 [Polistes exclamans]|nr:hypothetical protein M0804_001512 [Polistes exclamans]
MSEYDFEIPLYMMSQSKETDEEESRSPHIILSTDRRNTQGHAWHAYMLQDDGSVLFCCKVRSAGGSLVGMNVMGALMQQRFPDVYWLGKGPLD